MVVSINEKQTMPQKKPTVSIIIPTYDRPRLLEKAIISVLNQTYRNFQIIVVDDASQIDVSKTLRKKFGNTITYIRHDTNQGAAVARNTGLQGAEGEYCAFLDDDDLWVPEKLELQLRAFAEGDSNMGLVSCGHKYVYNDKVLMERLPAYRDDLYLTLLKRNVIGSVSLPLIRRDCLKSVGGFDPKLPSCQDWDLWLRLASNYSIGFINKVLVSRQIHPDQMTSDVKLKIEGRRIFLNKHIRTLRQYRRIYGMHLRRLGSLCLFAGLEPEALHYYIKAIGVYPLSLFSWVGVGVYFFPRRIQKAVLRRFSITRMGNLELFH